VVLRDLEELTIDEISGRLRSTRETVTARLHRARALLREYLIHED
jgi:DNA-directed RNA polymerase specialized sigma24 family protein